MGAGTGITVGFSFMNGLLLFCATLIVWQLSLRITNMSFTALIWIIMPIVSYLISFILNSAIQMLSCNAIQIQQIALNSIFPPVFVIAFLIISYLSMFRSPVVGVLPLGLSPELHTVLPYGFFLFWAGMFGEGLSAGFSQGCA
jgi:hypothetical protein